VKLFKKLLLKIYVTFWDEVLQPSRAAQQEKKIRFRYRFPCFSIAQSDAEFTLRSRRLGKYSYAVYWLDSVMCQA